MPGIGFTISEGQTQSDVVPATAASDPSAGNVEVLVNNTISKNEACRLLDQVKAFILGNNWPNVTTDPF